MNEIGIAEMFSGQRIDLETYAAILQKLNGPPVSVTLIPGRCGSTYFAKLIETAGVFGKGEEPFNERPRDVWALSGDTLEAAFELHMKLSMLGGSIWFQITPQRFVILASVLDPRILRSWKYTVILRRDILAQAISYIYAFKSGVWHSFQSDGALPVPLAPQEMLSEVRARVLRYLEGEAVIRAQLTEYAVSPALIQFYEDIAAGPQQEMIRFLRYNDVAYDPGRLPMATPVGYQKLEKAGDTEIYDQCLKTYPWLSLLLEERKSMPFNGGPASLPGGNNGSAAGMQLEGREVRSRPPEATWAAAELLALRRRPDLHRELQRMEGAKELAERLALERLDLLTEADERLAATEAAKETAERLALERQGELLKLSDQLWDYDQAKSEAEALAIGRMAELIKLEVKLSAAQNERRAAMQQVQDMRTQLDAIQSQSLWQAIRRIWPERR